MTWEDRRRLASLRVVHGLREPQFCYSNCSSDIDLGFKMIWFPLQIVVHSSWCMPKTHGWLTIQNYLYEKQDTDILKRYRNIKIFFKNLQFFFLAGPPLPEFLSLSYSSSFLKYYNFLLYKIWKLIKIVEHQSSYFWSSIPSSVCWVSWDLPQLLVSPVHSLHPAPPQHKHLRTNMVGAPGWLSH